MAFTNQKRKINILQVISFIFLSMFLAFGPLCKIAFAAPGTGLLGIMANYSSEIEPRRGDYFEITYKNKDSGATDSIRIDASGITESFKDFDIPAGSYNITDITYNGSNDAIVDSGYGIENAFRITEGGDDIVHIYIGASKTRGLENDYNSAVIKDSEHDENGNRTVFYDEGGAYEYQMDDSDNSVKVYLDEENNENAEEEDVYYDDFGDSSADIPTQTPNGQEPIIEYYDEEEETTDKGSSSIGAVIAIVCIVALAGCGAIFYLHQKGKI